MPRSLKRLLGYFVSILTLTIGLYVSYPHVKNIYYKLLSRYYNLNVTIVGLVDPLDSITSQPIRVAKMIDGRLKYNIISYKTDHTFLDEFIIKSLSRRNAYGKVVLVEDVLPLFSSWNRAFEEKLDRITINHHLPREDRIFITYSMIEGTEIMPNWVYLINNRFDMVVVPDPFLVDVYKKSGVKKPIFVLPLSMDLHDKIEKSAKAGDKFVFGNFSSTQDRKNVKKLIDAFKIVNQQRPNTFLHLYSRSTNFQSLATDIVNYIITQDTKNINFVLDKQSPNDYLRSASEIDAFVYPSKGEGFALQPRESMAMGIPVILTNNTAQSTICSSHFVRCVDAKIEKSAVYNLNNSFVLGNNFDCRTEDLVEAMIDMYDNYEKYLSQSDKMRAWVMRYSTEALREKYINMLQPKKVILGDHNEITDDYLMTDSEELYNKYTKVTARKKKT